MTAPSVHVTDAEDTARSSSQLLLPLLPAFRFLSLLLPSSVIHTALFGCTLLLLLLLLLLVLLLLLLLLLIQLVVAPINALSDISSPPTAEDDDEEEEAEGAVAEEEEEEDAVTPAPPKKDLIPGPPAPGCGIGVTLLGRLSFAAAGAFGIFGKSNRRKSCLV